MARRRRSNIKRSSRTYRASKKLDRANPRRNFVPTNPYTSKTQTSQRSYNVYRAPRPKLLTYSRPLSPQSSPSLAQRSLSDLIRNTFSSLPPRKRPNLCQRRTVRREVLFAHARGNGSGRPRNVRPPTFNHNSTIRC